MLLAVYAAEYLWAFISGKAINGFKVNGGRR